jgi:hypothetical protein
VPDEPKAIKELIRVLKNDGTALMMALINLKTQDTFEDSKIISAEDRLTFYGEPDLCRLHGLDFGKRLENQGFAVSCIDYREELPKEILSRNSLGDGQRELIFKCNKQ